MKVPNKSILAMIKVFLLNLPILPKILYSKKSSSFFSFSSITAYPTRPKNLMRVSKFAKDNFDYLNFITLVILSNPGN